MKIIQQSLSNSCNVACIMMVLDHFGKATNENAIRKSLPRHHWGSSMEEIKEFLEEKGLIASLSNIPKGVAIVSVDRKTFGKQEGRHYIVVEGLYVYDPLEAAPFPCARELLEAAAAPDGRGNGGFLVIKDKDLNH